MLSIFMIACEYRDLPDTDCMQTDLKIELLSKSNPVSCNQNDGTIEVSASGGKPSYQFRLGSGSFSRWSFFSALGAGSFIITVKDARGCEKQIDNIILTSPESPVVAVSASHQTNCLNPDGSITIEVLGGTPPYEYKIGNGSFTDSPTFSDLLSGLYTVTVKDANECANQISKVVESHTGISYQENIKPILEVNCIKAGCHNGDNGSDRDWRVFSNVQSKALNIRARTKEGTMPPGDAELSQAEIKLIACWVNEGAINN